MLLALSFWLELPKKSVYPPVIGNCFLVLLIYRLYPEFSKARI